MAAAAATTTTAAAYVSDEQKKQKKATKAKKKKQKAGGGDDDGSGGGGDGGDSPPSKKGPKWRLYTNEKKGYSCYKWGNQKMKGSIGLTTAWYYPTWNFEQSKRAKPSAAEAADLKGPACSHTTIAQAQERGIKVDDTLKYWVTYGDVGLKSIKLDKFSAALIAFFQQQKWKPYRCQKIVGLPFCRVASAIDLLMYNDKGELMLVEVKTTTGTYFTKDGGQTLAAPFEHVPSSAQTHAFLEAAFQKICWESEKASRPLINHVWVVCANGSGAVNAAQPGPWFTDVIAHMRLMILQRGQERVATTAAVKRKKAPAASAASAANTTKKLKTTASTNTAAATAASTSSSAAAAH